MPEENEIKISLLADDLASLENYIYDLLQFASIPVCFVSPMGVLLEVNPAFEEMSKFESDEIIGEPIERLFKKEDIKKLVNETFKKGFVKEREMILLPKQGKEIVAQVFTKVRKDEKGERVGYFLTLFDLTKIKKKEEELKEEIKKLKKGFKNRKK